MATVRVTCPTCSAELEIDEKHVGQEVECGSCQQVFVSAPPEGKKKPYRMRRSDHDEDDDRRPRRRSRRDDDDDDRPVGFRCPFCRTGRRPAVRNKISTTGWVVFVVLLLTCLPLCFIGLFITEPHRVCSDCGIALD